jgi:hypothetical protein
MAVTNERTKYTVYYVNSTSDIKDDIAQLLICLVREFCCL